MSQMHSVALPGGDVRQGCCTDDAVAAEAVDPPSRGAKKDDAVMKLRPDATHRRDDWPDDGVRKGWCCALLDDRDGDEPDANPPREVQGDPCTPPPPKALLPLLGC
jgi:hypothetical protein